MLIRRHRGNQMRNRSVFEVNLARDLLAIQCKSMARFRANDRAPFDNVARTKRYECREAQK